MCKEIGREDLLEREEYANPELRGINEIELAREIEEALMKAPRDEWLERLNAVNVPCGPIHNMTETFDHPQIQARGMAVEIDHPKAGRMKVLGLPPKMSGTPVAVRTPAPLLAQHTDEILRELDKSDEEIRRLRESGAAI